MLLHDRKIHMDGLCSRSKTIFSERTVEYMDTSKDTFDFKDFILTMLRRWRLFVVCILLFAILGAGFRALTSGKKTSETGLSTGLTAEQHAQLQAQEEGLLTQISEQEAYLTGSILLNLDARHLQICEVIMTLNPRAALTSDAQAFQLQSNAEALSSVLSGALKEDAAAAVISKALGLGDIDLSYIKELVSIEYRSGTAILVLRATYSTQKGAVTLAESAYQIVSDAFAKAGKFTSAYTLEKVGQSAYEAYMADHIQYRVKAEEHLKNLQTALTTVQTQLQVPLSTSGVSLTSCIKYGILGGAVGFVLAFLLTFFLDIMDPRLRSASQIMTELDLKVLGSLTRKKGE